jgi:2-succinyl-5-enolpyruvyl-6-hydroxy-3-cyclohexene-1-carboxylate synthase
MTVADPRVTARFLGAFFDELCRWGVRDVVVSPGSRSTPLSMVAYELSRRFPDRLRLVVDMDERGAAFVALGMAKASGRPAAVICTSGSAVANYYPAVMEAESSRVPLIVLTGDRPPQLQGLGAPQTCDQLHAFGTHVRAFRAMPLPAGDDASLAFARQAAREACIEALGSCEAPGEVAAAVGASASAVDVAAAADGESAGGAVESFRLSGACFGGPVHLNFPFDEPLKPDTSLPSLFEGGLPGARGIGDGVDGEAACEATGSVSAASDVSADKKGDLNAPEASLAALNAGVVQICTTIDHRAAEPITEALLAGKSLLMAGEGSCATPAEAREVLAFARAFGMPVLADPLSGLRCCADPLVMANYDSVLNTGGKAPDESLNPQVIVRFGRYPISKKATQWARALEAAGAQEIVVDPLETRETNAGMTAFVRSRPVDFCRALAPLGAAADQSFTEAWREANTQAGERIAAVEAAEAGELGAAASGAETANAFADAALLSAEANETSISENATFEGSVVSRVLKLVPEKSCLFAANSMSVRAVDTFMDASDTQIAVLANRGLNGIDGTVSTAIGTAFEYGRTTLVTGDLTMLHDLNSLALQREFGKRGDGSGLTIVLLNNNGGAIFDMLPQSSDDDYFERLFLTPQDVEFESAAAAFGVPYSRANDVEELEVAYRESLERPGISFIEVPVPLRGVRERYGRYW